MTILPSLIEALERHERVAAPDARIVYHAGTHTSETCPEIWCNSVTLKRIDLAGTSESWLVAVGYEHFTSDTLSAARALTVCDQFLERLRASGLISHNDARFVGARDPVIDQALPIAGFALEFVVTNQTQHSLRDRTD